MEGERGGGGEMAGRQAQGPVSHHRAVLLRLIVLNDVKDNHEPFGMSQNIIVSQKHEANSHSSMSTLEDVY